MLRYSCQIQTDLYAKVSKIPDTSKPFLTFVMFSVVSPVGRNRRTRRCALRIRRLRLLHGTSPSIISNTPFFVRPIVKGSTSLRFNSPISARFALSAFSRRMPAAKPSTSVGAQRKPFFESWFTSTNPRIFDVSNGRPQYIASNDDTGKPSRNDGITYILAWLQMSSGCPHANLDLGDALTKSGNAQWCMQLHPSKRKRAPLDGREYGDESLESYSLKMARKVESISLMSVQKPWCSTYSR